MMLGAQLGMENQQMTDIRNMYGNPPPYTMMQQYGSQSQPQQQHQQWHHHQ
ncbi:hypothetical protein KIN20_022934 [Parelaphostrongylus tenuis]|uniref:Uncharacterized protein n=1 Tax=Parelaphostrongylus tenuis TaxID=148309 RepID=A0AAD5QVL1_PARTN|nr:hypothetical protein KIN20_022934 [Parelaphostrongylus tenuis]